MHKSGSEQQENNTAAIASMYTENGNTRERF